MNIYCFFFGISLQETLELTKRLFFNSVSILVFFFHKICYFYTSYSSMSNIFRKKSNQFMLPSKITTRFSFSLNNFNLSATDVFVAPDLFRTSTSPTQSAWIPQNKKKNLIYFITFQIFFFGKRMLKSVYPPVLGMEGNCYFYLRYPLVFFGKKCATCTL